MASTHTRLNSPEIQASITLTNGRRIARSLHTQDRSLADRTASAIQSLVDALSPELKTRQTKLLALVEDIFDAAGVPTPWDRAQNVTVSALVAGYIASRENRIAASSVTFLRQTLESFARCVKLPAAEVTAQHVRQWFNRESPKIAASTMNNKLVMLRAAFSYALAHGWVTANPVNPSDYSVSGSSESVKQEMGDDALAVLCACLAASGRSEWLLATLFGRHLGMRLMDAVNLRVEDVSLDEAGLPFVNYVQKKTDKRVIVPFSQALIQAMSGIALPASGFYCPRLQARCSAQLSAEWVGLCTAAGIDLKEQTLPNGRKQRLITFHSLRASFITDLARRGVPPDVRMRLAGHSKLSTHGAYDKRSAADLRALLERA